MVRTTFFNKWIDLLRSNRFAKTTGKLRRVNGGPAKFCALGVGGCALGIDTDALTSTGANLTSQQVADLGMSESEAGVIMSLNDGQGLSFKQIADRLEDAASKGVALTP